jgi:hypothetical protein
MKFLLITFILIATDLVGQNGKSVFFIGHSLVNHNMPRMVDGIAKSKTFTNHTWERQLNNGANLKWNWEQSAGSEGVDGRVEIPSSNYDVVVMTEAVPLDNHIQWSQTYGFCYNWHELAVNANSNVQTYMFETWHCINSGLPAGCSYDSGDGVLWRTRLDTDKNKWEVIADSVNAHQNGNNMLLIPGGSSMARLSDSITAGVIPGISDIRSFFQDDIHMNDTGNYFIACVQFATIYGVSPVGAEANIKTEWGTDYNIPHGNIPLIQKLQEIAWEEVTHNPKTGVQIITALEYNESNRNGIYKTGKNNYSFQTKTAFEIINISGQVQMKSTSSLFSIANFPNGIYFVKFENQIMKIIKY